MPKKVHSHASKNRLITNIPIAQVGATMGDIQGMVFEGAKKFETIDYIYIVNKDNVLKGVISVKEFMSVSDMNTRVENVMKKDMIVAHPFTHQERLVYLALSHNIKAVPIVDKEGHLLGAVPYDALLKIFNEEAHEDMIKFGGIFHRVGKEFSVNGLSASEMVKHRLPWLVVGVLGGAVTASVVSGFENVLSHLIILAAFIPVLAYLGDAAGTQSETLIVRSIALNPNLSLRAYFIKEFMVACVLALICGLLLGAVVIVGWGDPLVGAIVGISMFLSIIAAIFFSTVLPILFSKVNQDPAFASGPFATMVSDIATILIYFVVASVLLGHYGLL